MKFGLKEIAVSIAIAMAPSLPSLAAELAPYGTAKVDMHKMPVTDTVFDVNYSDPQQLNVLYNFIKNTRKETGGKVVVVTRWPRIAGICQGKLREVPGRHRQDGRARRGRRGIQDVQ